jgi:hypothetical protein
LDYSFKTGNFRLPIENIKPEHAIEYRKIHDNKYLLIINDIKEIGGCGTIISQFRLPKIKADESVEFNCKIKKQQHNTDNNNIIVGIARNNFGKKRFVKPSLAWRLDLDKMTFVNVKTSNIICDTRGYR